MKRALEQAPPGYSPIVLKFGPYSASRLIVARCPARFQSKYIFKDLIVSDAVAASRGSAIHEVLQHISESHVKGLKFSPGQLDGWINEAIGKYPAAYA